MTPPKGREYVGSGRNPRTARGDDEHVLNRVFDGNVEKFNKWLETLTKEELDKVQKNPFTYKVKSDTTKVDTTKVDTTKTKTKSPVKDTVK